MPSRLFLAAACCLSALALSACGDDSDTSGTAEPPTAEWSYGGANGPALWGELDDQYELCAAGVRQSPIDLADAQQAPFPRITLNYVPEHLEVEDNGHSVEAEIVDPESSIEIAGTEYGLEQFHVHMPSEERFDGRQFPAIVHLVHVSADGGIAVMAVPVRPGAENPAFDFEVPDESDQGVRTAGTIDPADLLPERNRAYRYQGSLTTPPCTEGVIWTVFEQPITLSPEQLATLGSAHSGNARPVQPINGRSVKLGPALAS